MIRPVSFRVNQLRLTLPELNWSFLITYFELFLYQALTPVG